MESLLCAFCRMGDSRRLLGWNYSDMEPDDGSEVARLKGHERMVSALCLLPDGKLASCSSDRTIRSWDVISCEKCHEV